MKRKREKKWSEMKEWIDNGIGTEGAETISESLKINTSLTELYLGGDDKIRNEKRMKKEIMNKCSDNKISEETEELLGIWRQQHCSFL